MTQQEFSELMTEFLEPMVHQYLFLRRVYPERFFEKCVAYGVPIYRAKHPMLSHYITKVIQATRVPIAEGIVERFCVSLYSRYRDNTKVESMCVSLSQQHQQGLSSSSSSFSLGSRPLVSDALLLKNFFRESLFLLEGRLGGCPVPVWEGEEDVTFQVEIICKTTSNGGNGGNNNYYLMDDARDWICVESGVGDTNNSNDRHHHDNNNNNQQKNKHGVVTTSKATITPLKSLATIPCAGLELFVKTYL